MTKKTERPSFESVYMDFAKAIAHRSTCKRLQVGTVITSTDFRKVLAVGYNGNAAGLPNGCDRDEVGNCGCLHSEENAAINLRQPSLCGKICLRHPPSLCRLCQTPDQYRQREKSFFRRRLPKARSHSAIQNDRN